jgi:putative MATE family efflux protein
LDSGLSARQRDFRSEILRLAWPAIVENLLHTMVGIVDTAMVGRLGAGALAAVGLGNQVNQLGLTVFFGPCHRQHGPRGQARRCRRAGSRPCRGQAVLGLGSFCFWHCHAHLPRRGPGVLGVLFRRAEAAVLAEAAGYVRIVSLAMILNFFLIVINAVLRGAGDTKTPMQITALVNVINVVVNALFIYGLGPFPALGVAGAAVGTAVAQACGGLLALWVLLRNRLLPVRLTDSFRPDPEVIRRITSIGVPAGVEQGMLRVGQLIYTMIISSLGTVPYAAHQVALNAESLSFMPGAGFGVAATTLVGQNLGAGRPGDAEKAGRITRSLGMLVMSSMGLIFFLFPAPIVRIFSHDPEVLAQAVVCLRLVALAQPSLAVWMILAGGLRGAGDTRAIMKMVMVSFMGVRLGLAYVLSLRLGLGLTGAWIGMVADLFLRSLLIQRRFSRGGWKLIKV